MTSAQDAHRTLCRTVEEPYERARRWQAEGGLLVGYVGEDAPLELVDAVGALPVRLVARPEADRSAAGELLSGSVDPATVAILADLLDRVIVPDLVLVTHECDASLQLYYTLRELARIGRAPGRTDVALVDVLHERRRTTTAYVTEQLRLLTGRLEVLTSVAVTPATLARAVECRAALAQELAAVGERQRAGELPGAIALRYRLAASLLPPEEAVDLLAAVRDGGVEPPAGRPVLLTGSDHGTPDVYDRLAEAGWNVMADEALPVGAPSVTSLEALGMHCQTSRGGPHTRPVKERVSALADAGSSASAHVAYFRRGDEGLRWDVPALAEAIPVPIAVVAGQELGEIALPDDLSDLAGTRLEVSHG